MTKKKVSHSKKRPGHAKGKRQRYTKTARVLDFIIRSETVKRQDIRKRFRHYNKNTLKSIIYRLQKGKFIKRMKTDIPRFYPQVTYIRKKYKTLDIVPVTWYEHLLAGRPYRKTKKGQKEALYALTYAPHKRSLEFYLLRAIKQVTGASLNDYAYQFSKKKNGTPQYPDIEVGAYIGTKYRVIDTV